MYLLRTSLFFCRVGELYTLHPDDPRNYQGRSVIATAV